LSNEKKDLTRIEDLGEFIHELNAEEDFSSEDFSSELPDIPESSEESDTEEGESLFGSDFGNDFGSTEEATPFESANFETTTEDFTTSFSTDEDATPDWNSETSDEIQSEDSPLFSDETEKTSEIDPFADSSFESSFESPVDSPVEFKEEKHEEKIEDEIIEAPIAELAPLSEYKPSEDFKTPETFEDLKKFSESSSFTGMATEGNPSFSVLIKNVRFIEDINDIIALLRELSLMIDSEEQIKGRLMRGMLLIPRVSEYSAIYLAHKLRRFDIDIQVGLSDEIHPPKHQETPETGIVSKFNLFQNQTHHFQFDDPKLEISQIIVAATQGLEGHQVIRYMGVASEHKMLESHVVEDESSEEVPRHYQELAQKLKAHALKANANAVVGLNYQLTPIPSEFGMGGHKYRLTCTGNLVWVNKL